MANKKKRKNKKNSNIYRGQNVKQKNVAKNGQATASMTQENAVTQCDARPVKRYFGLSSKTWAIFFMSIIVLTFLIFLIVPYVVGLCIAAQKDSITEFLSGINYFTIFLSILGTAASVSSIIMTLVDRKRYNEEKEHSQELLSKLRDVSVCVETIQADNHSIKLDLLQIKDTIRMSKEVKDNNTGDWADGQNSGEINDDK